MRAVPPEAEVTAHAMACWLQPGRRPRLGLRQRDPERPATSGRRRAPYCELPDHGHQQRDRSDLGTVLQFTGSKVGSSGSKTVTPLASVGRREPATATRAGQLWHAPLDDGDALWRPAVDSWKASAGGGPVGDARGALSSHASPIEYSRGLLGSACATSRISVRQTKYWRGGGRWWHTGLVMKRRLRGSIRSRAAGLQRPTSRISVRRTK